VVFPIEQIANNSTKKNSTNQNAPQSNNAGAVSHYPTRSQVFVACQFLAGKILATGPGDGIQPSILTKQASQARDIFDFEYLKFICSRAPASCCKCFEAKQVIIAHVHRFGLNIVSTGN
jgi:hypothetical protein